MIRSGMIRHAAFLFAFTAVHAASALDVWKAKSEVRTVEPTAALKLTGMRKGDLCHSPRLFPRFAAAKAPSSLCSARNGGRPAFLA